MRVRKRGVQVLIGLLFIVAAFVFAGVGAMLAFFVLFCVGGVLLMVAKLYPSDRAREDKADAEDTF